ncbi:hypothetical protein NQ315_014572 [Exocentrus adspersus]|uniref:Gag protein n=1 Tax=Exocentrus adspersus TaxID=1586481 RepID=A0AAV8VEM8_9CUCU|nr:hypothetical protein NQ315_014572 [Exocentrus adspersus]
MATGVTFSEFNGEVDNWQMYSERLAEYFKANDVGEGKQVAKLLSILSPSTYKLLRDLCFPDLPNKKTFKQLSELLAGHYGHKPVVWHERSMFQDAKQEPGETISQWYARICSLAVDCKYQEEGELKNKLKEKFVTGMIRGRIFNRICEEDATITLEKLVEIAKKQGEHTKEEDNSSKEERERTVPTNTALPAKDRTQGRARAVVPADNCQEEEEEEAQKVSR